MTNFKPMSIISKIWSWPDGIVWKWTTWVSISSRRRKYRMFLDLINPDESDLILDIGVSGAASDARAENFLEEWYPNREQITAVGIDDLRAFKERYPDVRTVQADATKKLPFKDNQFDIVFSNAVIEHVGDRSKQKQFVKECLRVGKSIFITTPAKGFPVESHTLIPFAHYMPISMRNAIYRFFGRKHEGTGFNLHLLSKRDFLDRFPKAANVRIKIQRFLGFPSVLIAMVKEEYEDSTDK